MIKDITSMGNVETLINSGAQTLVVLTAKDLSDFADSLIRRTQQMVEAEYKDQYYSVEELARLLHVTQQTIYNMVRDGKLTSVKVGKRTLFSMSKVNQAINAGTLGRYVHK